jgi:hypothetical protein
MFLRVTSYSLMHTSQLHRFGSHLLHEAYLSLLNQLALGELVKGSSILATKDQSVVRQMQAD